MREWNVEPEQDSLRQATANLPHLPPRFIGWQERKRDDQNLFYTDTLVETAAKILSRRMKTNIIFAASLLAWEGGACRRGWCVKS